MPTISRTPAYQTAVTQPTSTHGGYPMETTGGNTAPDGFQNPHAPHTVPPGFGIYIQGTAGNDQIFGTAYADSLYGNGGNDSVQAGDGNDYLSGGAGNDFLVGGDGDDTVDGGAGNDFMVAGDGTDKFFGGEGADTLSFASTTLRSGGVTVDLTADFNTTGDTIVSIENLVGSSQADVFNGNIFANRLEGGAGDDWLFGQGGNDMLFGGNGADNLEGGIGDDLIDGGAGNDRLTGGQGADTFVVTPGSGPDFITDFLRGADMIALSGFEGNPFGDDGLLAVGRFSHLDENDTPSGHRFQNLDLTDEVLFDLDSNTLFRIDPRMIAGEIQEFNAVELVQITFDPASPFQPLQDSFFIL